MLRFVSKAKDIVTICKYNLQVFENQYIIIFYVM